MKKTEIVSAMLSDILQNVEVFLHLLLARLLVLAEAQHALEVRTLHDLGSEFARGEAREVGDDVQVLLESGDLLLGLVGQVHVVIVFHLHLVLLFLGLLLFGGSSLRIECFLLLDFDSHETLSEYFLGLLAVEESHWRLFVLVGPGPHLKESVEDIQIVAGGDHGVDVQAYGAIPE